MEKFQKNMLKYFKSELESVNRNFKLTRDKNDEDGVHDLRVELKRLKAFFNLVEASNPDFIAQYQFKEFRKIAKKTSAIRDAQVQKKLLSQINKLLQLDVTAFDTYLNNLELKGLKSFQRFSPKWSLKNLAKAEKSIKDALKSVSSIAIETRCFGRFHNLKNNMILLSQEKILKDDKLHKVRILSKETHYTLDILNTCFPVAFKTKKFISDIKNVHKNLGIWHDYQIAFEYLDDYLKTNTAGFPIESSRQIKHHITAEKKRLNSDFKVLLQTFADTAVTTN